MANAWATIAGLYRNEGVRTLVPIVTRLVAAAAAPSQTSAFGAWPSVWRQGWKWSLVQTESKPDCSAADGEVEQAARMELLRRCLVAEDQRGLRRSTVEGCMSSIVASAGDREDRGAGQHQHRAADPDRPLSRRAGASPSRTTPHSDVRTTADSRSGATIASGARLSATRTRP